MVADMKNVSKIISRKTRWKANKLQLQGWVHAIDEYKLVTVIIKPVKYFVWLNFAQ